MKIDVEIEQAERERERVKTSLLRFSDKKIYAFFSVFFTFHFVGKTNEQQNCIKISIVNSSSWRT